MYMNNFEDDQISRYKFIYINQSRLKTPHLESF